MTDHSHSEEPSPNVQAELPLMQLHSISSCPVDGHQRQEISTRITLAQVEDLALACYTSCDCPAP